MVPIVTPFVARNDGYSTATLESVWGVSGVGNLFASQVSSNGVRPTYIQYTANTEAYRTDWDRWAPNLGFAWRPSARSGLFHKVLGNDGSVIRGGYTLAYNRNGMNDFSSVFSGNPGSSVSANRDVANNNLGTLPQLLRDPSRAFAPSPVYPMAPPQITNSANIFDSNLQVPYAQSYTIGWQRALSRNMAFEIRYVGTRQDQGFRTFNLNGEPNIVENGFVGPAMFGRFGCFHGTIVLRVLSCPPGACVARRCANVQPPWPDTVGRVFVECN